MKCYATRFSTLNCALRGLCDSILLRCHCNCHCHCHCHTATATPTSTATAGFFMGFCSWFCCALVHATIYTLTLRYNGAEDKVRKSEKRSFAKIKTRYETKKGVEDSTTATATAEVGAREVLKTGGIECNGGNRHKDTHKKHLVIKGILVARTHTPPEAKRARPNQRKRKRVGESRVGRV